MFVDLRPGLVGVGLQFESSRSTLPSFGHIGDVSQFAVAAMVGKPYGERPDDREPALRQPSPGIFEPCSGVSVDDAHHVRSPARGIPGALPHRIRVTREAQALGITLSGQTRAGGR
jgi:hypothetical protein